jgi:signal transduction histidine kinase
MTRVARNLGRPPPAMSGAAAAGSRTRIEHVARSSLSEIRRAVSLLRDGRGGADRSPQPGVAQVEELIGRFRAAGLTVEYRMDIDGAQLTPAVGLAVYRVVQECLTNVLKHAGPASATVGICGVGDAVDVIVTDDGCGVAPHSNGFGLAGLSERVALHGGRIDAGPRDDGDGFRVTVRLPRSAAVGEHAT